MTLSTRLTFAMVALVLITAAAVRNSSLLAGLAAVVCVIALAVVLARMLTRPLVQMAQAAEDFSRHEQVEMPTGAGGEIGALARAFTRMAGEIRDLTEKIAAEERARQSQRMEAVGQLVAGIAHDFNNMLTVITGTIEILAEGVAEDPQLASIAKLIGDAADRGDELTGRLLAFARKQPLQPRETEINDLIHAACGRFRPSLGEQVEIEAVVADDAWPALVDPTQLTTALINLAVNARDAMPNGGKLTLETKNVVLDESYARANRDVVPGSYVMIAVSDSGDGIAPDILDRVFEPFFTTKEPGRGTGLGLSMVYGFVKQSNGHIKIYSEERHGTTIKLYLPRSQPQLAPAA